MSTRRRYTVEDESIIFEEVSLHPTNISKGLEIAADRCGRTIGSVKYHWYAVQSKRDEACFFCTGRDKISKNRKIVKDDTYSDTKLVTLSIFTRILRWLGLK